MKYNIIGDIHGRTSWKDLVQEDCVNIFVGDYFSPYDNISFQEQRENFYDIIKYKQQHPETILLIGNHDEDHWHINEMYSRYDAKNFERIKKMFETYKDMFQIAYSIENKILVTHAGVSILWYKRYHDNVIINSIDNLNQNEPDKVLSQYSNKYITVDNPIMYRDCKTPLEAYAKYTEKYFKFRNKEIIDSIIIWHDKLWEYDYKVCNFVEFKITPDELAKFINNLWLSGNYKAFNFRSNSEPNDYYGESATHGPIWIRPNNLTYTNIFAYSDFYQVVGHTQHRNVDIDKTNNIAYVDCLGYNEESLLYDGEFKVNKNNI